MAKWGVYLRYRQGMAPVSFCLFVAFSLEGVEAFCKSLPIHQQKAGCYYKEYGVSKHMAPRHWWWMDKGKKKKEKPKPPPDAPPLELPAPPPMEPKQVPMWDEVVEEQVPKITSIWKYDKKPTKRRL